MFKVLIVDDEEIILSLLKQILRKYPIICFGAKNGEEGLSLFKEQLPSIVITDIYMPKMNGLELTKKILQIQPQTYVVMITGHGSEEHAIEALRSGASNYFKKPLSVKEIQSVIEKQLKRLEITNKEKLHKDYLNYQEIKIEIPSDPNLIPGALGAMKERYANNFEETVWTHIQIGIDEMIINAIEHGNLEIGSSEKSKALEASNFSQLLKEKCEDPVLSKRKVFIETKLTEHQFYCSIRDEGEGFDWRSLPDPSNPENLLKEHGRGIFITSHSFDEVKFNEKGNQVILTKNIT